MRYCIGCVHLVFKDKRMGFGTPQTGSWTVDDATIRCDKGHWEKPLEEGPIDLEASMLMAVTCPDYEERPHDSP